MKKNDIPVCEDQTVHTAVVSRAQSAIPEGDDFYHLANLYKMFSDPTRLRILWALSVEDMCVCDLAALLNMTNSAISHQLKSLRLVNLVRYDRQGKEVYYSLADDHVKSIFEKGMEHIRE